MDEEEAGARVDGFSRRAFLRKMAIVGFAGPIVASFTIDGLAGATEEEEASEEFPGLVPNQAPPEQEGIEGFFGEGEEVPGEDFWNQSFANQYTTNQFLANQLTSNQTYFPNQLHA